MLAVIDKEPELAPDTAGKVVVVNDDATQLHTLAALLRKAGLDAVCFSRAEAALAAMVQGGKPCLVVTDIYMPVIDGWRFCRLLRSSDYPSLNHIPILVVSATFAGDETTQIAADLGAEAFLPCPVDGDQFLGVVKELIEGQEARRVLRALVLEDDAALSKVVESVMRRAGYEVTVAGTLAEARAIFRNAYYDVAIVDEHLPDGPGSLIMETGHSEHAGCAFIMISGNAAPGKYLEWMKAGASASLSKPFDVAYLLECCEKARRERALLRTEELLELRTQELMRRESEYRSLVRGIPDAVLRFDREARCLYASENVEDLLGVRGVDGSRVTSIGLADELVGFWVESIEKVFESGEAFETEFVLEQGAGRRIFNWRLLPEFRVGKTSLEEEAAGVVVQSVLTFARDITEGRMSELRYQRLFREMLSGFAHNEVICDEAGRPVDYRFLTVNPAFEKMTGKSSKSIIGKTALEVFPDLEHVWIERFGQVAITGKPDSFESFSDAVGRKWFEVSAYSPTPGQFAVMFEDISERKQAEVEHDRLNAQLRQAQKMETVGRLAGGVAHDFNNMLSVILGNIELAIEMLDGQDSLRDCLQEAFDAAMRSAEITRQLLAFSRRQTIAPVALDLNLQVAGLLKMLTRLIGEGISLDWLPADNLWAVCLDPSQIDQILANLCVNARDAFGGRSGRIVISTSNCELDDAFCESHIGSRPGSYVRLQVRDTGCGMTAEVMDHLFEPFFTTKEQGKGTGLGLSTVYGIVKQNNGYIHVESEIGAGTSISIFLPRTMDKVHEGACDSTVNEMRLEGAGETILVVEDEPAVRQICEAQLRQAGFQVKIAHSVEGAITAVAEMDQPPDIVLTDMIMPGEQTGIDLIQILKPRYPGTAFLLMSGYDGGVLRQRNVDLDRDVQMIQKPFTAKQLTTKICELLRLRQLRLGNPGDGAAEVPLSVSKAGDATDRAAAAKPVYRRTEGASVATDMLRVHSMESVGRLVGTLLHETNNQLMVMQWYADQAMQQADSGVSCVEWVKRIYDASQEGVKVTRQLLAKHMRNFSAQQDILPQHFDVVSAILAIRVPLEELIGGAARLVLTLPEVALPLYMDPAQLDQILVSMCMNARDAVGKADGKIEIFAGEVDLEAGDFRDGEADMPGRYIMLGVRDNGRGILPDIQKRIFEPFFTTNGNMGAVGLGLTLVEGIVRQNKGIIRFESTLEEGSCFRVYFSRSNAD